MKDQSQGESASLGKKSKTREQPYLTRFSLEQSGPKIPCGLKKCMHCMEGKSTDRANS